MRKQFSPDSKKLTISLSDVGIQMMMKTQSLIWQENLK